MQSEKQRELNRSLWLAWALWVFWTSEECVQFLRLLNPRKSWQELRLSFDVFANLAPEVAEDLYARLHQRESTPESKWPNILHDLCMALPPNVSETLTLVA